MGQRLIFVLFFLMVQQTFCLWFGWYGFNPGSVLVIANDESSQVAALVVVNTTLGACAGAVSAMFFSSWWDWRATGEVSYDVGATMNGCLTGLVSITAGCATVETWAAVVIGIFAGLFYLLGSKLLIRLRIDDAVDAIPVHAVGGAWGMISAGLLTSPELLASAYEPNSNVGWFYEWSNGSGNFTLIGIQLVAVLFVFSWTMALMGFWFGMINCMGWFRVDELEELAGMDVSRHKGAAYDYTAPHDESVKELMVRRESNRHSSLDHSSSQHSSTNKNASGEENEVVVAESTHKEEEA